MNATLQRRVYRPRGAARALLECRDPEVLVSGPAGTGKSRVCLEKAHHMLLANPGMKAMFVRKTHASLGSTVLETFRKFVAFESIELGEVHFYGGSAQEAPQYRYRNGSKIYLGGLDKPTKIMSSEVDLVYAAEATELTVTDWEFLNTRLRNGRVSFQQIIADANPDRPTHWLKQRCDDGRATLLYSRHEDNPILYGDDGAVTVRGEAYMAKLDALTGVRKQRLRYGRWVGAEGIVFDQFDPAEHLVDRPKEPPQAWRRKWTVDFGFRHPFVCQMWAINPDGVAFRYREFFGTNTLVEDWAEQILDSVTREDGTWKEPKPEAIICDHDAEDRATLERHLKLPTWQAKKTVSDGLQAVNVRFKTNRLYLVRDALVRRDPLLVEAGRPTCTEEELGSYVWNVDKDAPVKDMDDGADCMRYLVADEDLQPKYRVRHL